MSLEIPLFTLLLAVELWIGYRRGQRLYRLPDAVTDLGLGLGQQVVGIFVRAMVFALYLFAYRTFALVQYAPGSWIPWVVAFLGVDLAYYGFHRMSHEVTLLWAIHQVHHQSEDYNFAVALRQPWFSDFTAILFYWPFPFLGVPLPVFLTAVAFLSLYQVSLHTRTVGKPGWWGRWINTPSHHRVHHGRNLEYLDRNFGATLIVWDRLFRTFRAEAEEPAYGTVEPYRSWNPLWANVSGFVHLGRLAWAARRPWDKVRVWFKRPGWIPPGAESVVAARASVDPAIRWDPSPPPGMGRYVLVHFGVATLACWALLLLERGMPMTRLVAPTAVVVAALAAWGGLMEGKRWGPALELARLAATAALVVDLAARHRVPWLGATAIVLALASALWMLRLVRGARARIPLRSPESPC